MPKSNVGTMQLSDLLSVRHLSVLDFGLDRTMEIVQADLAAHNAIMQEMVGTFCEVTTDLQRIYGMNADTAMQEVDQYGVAPTEKVGEGYIVGFPLKSFQRNVGFTADFLRRATPADIATQITAIQKAHVLKLVADVKKAVHSATNFTHYDYVAEKSNNIPLYVKRFVNGDGAAIPNGPNGEQFDGSTHSHYLFLATGANAAALEAKVIELINHVVEHGHGNSVKLVINYANEAAVRACPSFVAYMDPRLTLGTEKDKARTRLDITRIDNRAIGLLGAAEVWVKPYAVPNYLFCSDFGAERKGLVYRQPVIEAERGLQLVAENVSYPLQAQIMQARHGIGAWERTNGAVLQINGDPSIGVYTEPTII